MNYATTLHGISEFRVAIRNQLCITIVTNEKIIIIINNNNNNNNNKTEKKEDFIRRLSRPSTQTRVSSVKRINSTLAVLRCPCEKMDKVEEVVVPMASLFL